MEFDSCNLELEWEERFPEAPLHPLMQAHIDGWQVDKHNNVVDVMKPVEAHSLVRNFAALVATSFRWAGSEAVRISTGGYVYPPYNNMPYFLSAGTSTYMPISVGLSGTTVTLNDYALGSRILDGTGLNQLVYGATSVVTMETTSTMRKMMFSRAFTNAYSSTLTVQEVAIVGALYYGSWDYLTIIDRSLLTQAILPGNTQTFRYTISVVV